MSSNKKRVDQVAGSEEEKQLQEELVSKEEGTTVSLESGQANTVEAIVNPALDAEAVGIEGELYRNGAVHEVNKELLKAVNSEGVNLLVKR